MTTSSRRRRKVRITSREQAHESLSSFSDRLGETGQTVHIPIGLRTYVSPGRARGGSRRGKAGPSEWSLIFDTETTTDAAQRMRFGAYQVRYNDDLIEKGLFFDPDVLVHSEQRILIAYARGMDFTVRTLTEFIEKVFFDIGYAFEQAS